MFLCRMFQVVYYNTFSAGTFQNCSNVECVLIGSVLMGREHCILLSGNIASGMGRRGSLEGVWRGEGIFLRKR